MRNTAERWTAEEVRALPQDGNRYELVSGELVVTPSPAYVHQAAVFALLDRLRPWVRSIGLGEALGSPADISLGEDEVLQPDLFVFRQPVEKPVHSWTDITALVLAVEVLSPSTARYDRTLKRRRYQRAGVPEYWIVDLDARLVERWRPADSRPEIVTERLTWQPDAGGPGLEIDLTEVFAAVMGD